MQQEKQLLNKCTEMCLIMQSTFFIFMHSEFQSKNEKKNLYTFYERLSAQLCTYSILQKIYK